MLLRPGPHPCPPPVVRTRPDIRRVRCRPRRVVFARADEHEHKSLLPLHPEAGTTPHLPGMGSAPCTGFARDAEPSSPPRGSLIPASRSYPRLPRRAHKTRPTPVPAPFCPGPQGVTQARGDPAHRPISPREHQSARGTGHPVTYRRAAAKRQRSASPSLLRVQLAPHTTLRCAHLPWA
jgi:hypothetical protein